MFLGIATTRNGRAAIQWSRIARLRRLISDSFEHVPSRSLDTDSGVLETGPIGRLEIGSVTFFTQISSGQISSILDRSERARPRSHRAAYSPGAQRSEQKNRKKKTDKPAITHTHYTGNNRHFSQHGHAAIT